MSDIESTAATQGTSSSSMPNSYSSPASSQNTAAVNGTRSSRVERGRRRRRRHSPLPFPEIHYDSDYEEVLISQSSRFLASQSVPNLPSYASLPHVNELFQPQPRTFLGHDREFMSHIISSRGVARTMNIIQSWTHIPGLQRFLEYIPVPSADGSRFVGWRHKVDTWPLDNGRYMQRAFTSPNW